MYLVAQNWVCCELWQVVRPDAPHKFQRALYQTMRCASQNSSPNLRPILQDSTCSAGLAGYQLFIYAVQLAGLTVPEPDLDFHLSPPEGTMTLCARAECSWRLGAAGVWSLQGSRKQGMCPAP